MIRNSLAKLTRGWARLPSPEGEANGGQVYPGPDESFYTSQDTTFLASVYA